MEHFPTKKQLLKSKGKKFTEVESHMKTIEKSLGKEVPREKNTADNDMIMKLKKEIVLREKLITKWVNFINTFYDPTAFSLNREINTKKQTSIVQEQVQLEMLETQLNGKVLQMKEKHAKLSRLHNEG